MYIRNNTAVLEEILVSICKMVSRPKNNEAMGAQLRDQLHELFRVVQPMSLEPIPLYSDYYLAAGERTWIVDKNMNRVKDPVDVCLIAIKAIRIMLAKAARNEAELRSAFDIARDRFPDLKTPEAFLGAAEALVMGSCGCSKKTSTRQPVSVEIPKEEKDPLGFIRKAIEEMYNVGHMHQEAKEAFSKVVEKTGLYTEIDYLIGLFCERFIAPGLKATIKFSGCDPIFVQFVPSHNRWTIVNRKEIKYSEELKNKLLAHLNGAEV